jgi:hypothetical protein
VRVVAGQGNWLQQRREDAWLFGRNLAADLTERYRQQYKLPKAPPPAIVVYELLTDFLGARLSFDPLPDDRFAQTRWVDGVAHVAINSRADRIRGVRDVEGVQRVAAWHEAIHVAEDADAVRSEFQGLLPGLDLPAENILYREKKTYRYDSEKAREFRAEEAGRAAAVSIWVVERCDSWQHFLARGEEHPTREVVGGWRLLYRVAEEIGVNITALVKQLEFEDHIRVERQGRDAGGRLFVPARLLPRGDTDA